MELLPEEVMTEASLLAEECCTSRETAVTSVAAATHQQAQSDHVIIQQPLRQGQM